MLDGITNSMGMNLSKLQDLVMDRKAWLAAVHAVTRSQTRQWDCTELNTEWKKHSGSFYLWIDWLKGNRSACVRGKRKSVYLNRIEAWEYKHRGRQVMVLEKTHESPLDFSSPLDSKEIKPVNPKGNQSCIFTGRTGAETEAPKLWPPSVKSRLIGKDPDAGKDWEQEEKRWQRIS